jgi:formylmethanofuran dehydrogenase subunit E
MDHDLWKACVAFHGHSCPGLAFGYRASELAAEQLGIPLDRARDEELVCVAENDACGLDCIQYLLSCTVGKGNLILRIRGKSAYTFFDRRTGKGVRLVARPFDREAYSREELTERLLTLPVGEVFEVKEPLFGLPEKARIFDSRTCAACGEAVREDLIRFQDGVEVCLDCFSGYDRGW